VLRIGLTGGIASGKSTVARMFAELGVEVIDTDEIAHQLVAPGSRALAAVIEAFGRNVLTEDGALDRPQMRRIVFADSGKRRRLETILHPLIRQAALARAAASDASYVMLVVPLLFETGFDQLVNHTLAIDCPEALQIERLVDRDNVSTEEAQAMIASQLNREERRVAADDVIDSSGSLATIRGRVSELHEQYLDLKQNCPDDEGRAE